MLLKGPAFVAVALMFLVPMVRAADDSADVSTILAQMRKASGGDAWTTVRALHVITNAKSGGEAEAREHWEDVSTGRYQVSAAGGHGTTQQGFDGITSWRQDRSGVAYTLGDIDSALVSADESFRVARAWWFRDRHPATIAYAGERSEKGKTFDLLDVTPESGRLFEAWIDRSTHLLDHSEEQQAEDKVVTHYGDYRSVDGLVIPFLIEIGDGSNASFDDVETVRSVDVNPAVADSRYAVPPLPASDITLPPGRDSIDVPFRLAGNNRILVPVTLNSRVTVEAEFDSGGSLILQPASLQKLGISSRGHYKESGGGEGSITSAVGELTSLDMGEARVRNLSYTSFAFNSSEPEAALVGLEILQRFVVRFDFDRMTMTLTKPDAFHYDGQGVIVPFHFQDNQPEVKGSIDGIAGLFAIDTGDNSSLLLIAPFARRYGLVDRYQADIPYGGNAVTATHGVWARKRPQIVSFDGPDGRPAVTVHNPVTRISLQHAGFDANRNVSANIGLGILRQFNLTFDYARQRLVFEPNHFFGQPDVFNRTGFRLEHKGEAWTVSAVYPRSPAAEAGMQTGDQVQMINGRRITDYKDDELASTLKGPIGTSLIVQLRSAKKVRSVKLVLRDVL